MKLVSVAFLVLFLFVRFSFSCTVSEKSLSKFDETEYIFIGTVIGYTKPIEFDEDKGNDSVKPISATDVGKSSKSRYTNGLIVRVDESVYLPNIRKEFEIFPFDLWADCSIGGISLSKLEFDFPINAEIRVIAKESKLLTNTSGGRIKLEEIPGDAGQIIKNSDRSSKKLTSASSTFNYGTYQYDVDKSASYYLLPSFEARKDLLKLKQAKTQSERNLILDRFVSAPINIKVELHELFKFYAANEAEAKRFYETYLKSKDPEGYKLFQSWEKAVDELSKLGYQRPTAERAMNIALEEGIYIDDKNFLLKCKEILSKDKKPKQ